MNSSLTTGTPWKAILIFAIPLLVGNAVQQMYQVFDAMVVGQHLGVNSLAAVGTTGGIFFLLIGFAWGMTSGFAIPTAQAFGAGDNVRLRRTIAAGTVLTMVTSVIITIGGVIFSRSLLTVLQTPAELIDEATTFATINFAGATATMMFNYLSAVIRAIGDSRTPLVFLVISCGINAGLVLLFVGRMGTGVGGAACATILAQVFSVLLCFLYIWKALPALHVHKDDWIPGLRHAREQIKIGLPMGFQMSIIAIGTLVVQVRLNTLGAESVAAYTTAVRVDGLAVALLESLGIAASTFVAQNFGAGQHERILVGVRQAVRISVVSSIILAATLITAGNTIVRSFVGEGNDNVVAMAHEYLVVNGAMYWVLGILFITRGSLQGLGKAIPPTISGVFELAMRVATAIVLGGMFGFAGIVWGNPLAWVGAVMVLIPSWLRARHALDPRSKEHMEYSTEGIATTESESGPVFAADTTTNTGTSAPPETENLVPAPVQA
ncbi:MATE family efflux transporter [Arcanobacterium haemolyticum]|nr:MATE family efflux transporter [Arcanobacterium haemolyticum]